MLAGGGRQLNAIYSPSTVKNHSPNLYLVSLSTPRVGQKQSGPHLFMEKITRYFTLGQIHVHAFMQGTLTKDTIVKITAHDPRLKMVELCGIKWAFEYEECPDLKHFKCVIDVSDWKIPTEKEMIILNQDPQTQQKLMNWRDEPLKYKRVDTFYGTIHPDQRIKYSYSEGKPILDESVTEHYVVIDGEYIDLILPSAFTIIEYV